MLVTTFEAKDPTSLGSVREDLKKKCTHTRRLGWSKDTSTEDVLIPQTRFLNASRCKDSANLLT